MLREDVVAYLKAHIQKFSIEDLRDQLTDEGVSAAEFDAAFDRVLREGPPSLKAADSTRLKAKASGAMGRVLMFAGAGAILGAAALALIQKPAPTPADDAGTGGAAAGVSASSVSGESGFIGRYGYVVKLPPGYAAVQSFKDEKKTIEIVHFCKSGTDATNFLNEALFGQMGIVRLEVQPRPAADDLSAAEKLTSYVVGRAQRQGEKFTTKPLQISSLRGIQISYEAPNARVEAYVLGDNALYSFMGGLDDEIFQGLLQSLRDAHSEL